jgi:hypothetical protein
MPSKINNIDDRYFNRCVDKTATAIEKVFGIHRNEFLNPDASSIQPVVRAKAWFIFVMANVYNVPRAQITQLNIGHLQSFTFYIKKIGESHDKKDIQRLNRIYQILGL